MASMKYDPSYDFSNKGVDWEEYQREARLRTDAVWERQKLKDYFRLFYKIFFWDPKTEKYYIAMPNHKNYNSPDGWRFKAHNGYGATGRSDSFQRAKGNEFEAASVSVNSLDSVRDKNALCYVRFRNYRKCEGDTLLPQVYEEPNEDGTPEKVNMKCYGEMLDLMEYCDYLQLNWLSDMWHQGQLNQDRSTIVNNDEFSMLVDEFDNPDVDVKSY